MSEVFRKLNLKDQAEILVLNSPQSFDPELGKLKGVAIKRAVTDVKQVGFMIVFVTTEPEIERAITKTARKLTDDPVVWFAYPKGSSKNYRCEINRDRGWAALGRSGFEAVRMIAIDADWTAARYRRATFIRTMTRDVAFAASRVGRQKAAASSRASAGTRSGNRSGKVR